MRALKLLLELIILLAGAIAAGFLVGTAQHFVMAGVWGHFSGGYGFGRVDLALAALKVVSSVPFLDAHWLDHLLCRAEATYNT